jgi:CO/xanthine dehydrogenase Mo-binding subunit
MTIASARTVLAAPDRVEGHEKVTGAARYAYEYAQDEVAYAAIVQARIAKGAVDSVDASAALALPGVLAVLSCENAPRLHQVDDEELALFQSRRVAYRGQVVAAVVADSYETARQARRLVRIDTPRSRTTWSCASTIHACTGRPGSTRTSRPIPSRAIAIRRWRPRR